MQSPSREGDFLRSNRKEATSIANSFLHNNASFRIDEGIILTSFEKCAIITKNRFKNYDEVTICTAQLNNIMPKEAKFW